MRTATWGALAVALTAMASSGAQAADASKFMAVGTYTAPDAVPAASLALQQEQETMKLYLNGKVEQFWFRRDGKGVVLLVSAGSQDEATALLGGLPYAKTNAIRFEVFPIGPMIPFVRLLDDGLVHGP